MLVLRKHMKNIVGKKNRNDGHVTTCKSNGSLKPRMKQAHEPSPGFSTVVANDVPKHDAQQASTSRRVYDNALGKVGASRGRLNDIGQGVGVPSNWLANWILFHLQWFSGTVPKNLRPWNFQECIFHAHALHDPIEKILRSNKIRIRQHSFHCPLDGAVWPAKFRSLVMFRNITHKVNHPKDKTLQTNGRFQK